MENRTNKKMRRQDRVTDSISRLHHEDSNAKNNSDIECLEIEHIDANTRKTLSPPGQQTLLKTPQEGNRIWRGFKHTDYQYDTDSTSDDSMLANDTIPKPEEIQQNSTSKLAGKFRWLSKIAAFKDHRKNVTTRDADLLEEKSPLDNLVCYMKDNPYKLHKCAQNGNVKEVARILQNDPSRLHAYNVQGQMPIHVASAKGHVGVMQTLLDHDVDVDAQNKQGNTALHLSVKERQYEVVQLLISNGAKVDVFNNNQMAPLHVAAEEGDADVVKHIMEHTSQVDVMNLTGENGQTAMHFAASKDHGEFIRTLIHMGGLPCIKDDYGYYPIHVAAKCSAADAMEAIIEHALTRGYTRETILTFKDRENNMPLHAAVNGGDIKAVLVCLKAGASVRVQQDDGSTPVHFAAAQGNMEMIKLMESMQPDNFLTAVFTEDAMRMTPLHRAALFDHADVLASLLEHSGDIDAKDGTGRTPLLLAASKGCWCTVKLLIKKGADVHVKDKNNRNFLHLAVRFGGKLEQIGGDFIRDIKNLQNERDDFGCTPLHYASKEGHLFALDDLIRMGAVINPKNNDKQSPFHFAARYGRYNTCLRLLDSVHGPNIINETDCSGLTALHIAAQNGNTKVIQLLLAKGAIINKDHENNTALHHAAANGWTHSMKILLGVRANLIDIPNLEGDTALHVAAKMGQTSAVSLLLTLGAELTQNNSRMTFIDFVIQSKHFDVAMAAVNHDRWKEIMGLCSHQYGCAFLGLIQQLPDACMAVMNRCQTYSPHEPRSTEYHVTYDFTYMEVPSGCISSLKDPTSDYTAMIALKKMVENNRVECLSHPVCETFLKAKWARYGCLVYTLYLSVYATFLSCLTAFICNHNSLKHYDYDAENATYAYLYGNKDGGYNFSMGFMICLVFILVYSGGNIIKEIVQIITQKTRYFYDFQNYVEWALYATCLVFVVPFILDKSLHWQWESGAVAVFLAWFNLLVFLQRFDFFGIYVVMFLEILNTLLQVLCVFSILIIAFGISFFMLLHNEDSKAYSTPGLSLLRTFMMMLELDYMGSFNSDYVDGDDKTLHFGTLTLIMLVVFVLFMPILLMNLLIGLAVGDIEAVQRNARLKRMAMQVQLHADMEAKMPLFLLKRAAIFDYDFFPNKCRGKLGWFFDFLLGSVIDLNTRELDVSCNPNTYVIEEMHKQKVRLRDMGSVLEKNNVLLRKIMQKMEITTEDDAWDEGVEHDSSGDELKSKNTDPAGMHLKRKLQLKSTALSGFQKGQNK